MLGPESTVLTDFSHKLTPDQLLELELERKLFVGNLPASVSEKDLSLFFSLVGPVETVSVKHRDGSSAGYGFVTFLESTSILKALEQLKSVPLQNQLLIMEPTSSNLTTSIMKEPLSNHPENITKKITEHSVPTPSDSSSRGRGRPSRGRGSRGTSRGNTTRLDEDSFRLLELVRKGPPPPVRGRRFPLPPAHFKPLGDPSDTTVYVGNLGVDIDESRLCSLFEQWNPVKVWLVYRANTKNPKGFGFVELPDSDTQSLVLSQPPIMYQERMLFLRAAVLPKSEVPFSSEPNLPSDYSVDSSLRESPEKTNPPLRKTKGFNP